MYDFLYSTFRDWGENGKIWLVSDTHFDDYSETEWMPALEIIKKIKAVIREQDTLICLGDCGKVDYFKDISCEKKILVMGNHDEKEISYYVHEGGFCQVYDGPLFIARDILLSHEPIYGITRCLNIHGHMHTGKHIYTDELGGKHVNLVGPAVQYEPLELMEILNRVKEII